MNNLLRLLIALSSGLFISGGVFTVLFAVGLLPRFAYKTKTARFELLYENFVIAGTLVGILGSVYNPMLAGLLPGWLANGLLALLGVFAGIFAGCLALATAELLDGIPIFARRVSMHEGLFWVVGAIALGKLAGSVFYFFYQLY